MQIYNLNNFTGGWVIGDFNPAIINSKEVEVAIKKYKKGDYEPEHYHKLATEITIIVSGKVRMNNQIFTENQIVLIDKNDKTDFFAIRDSTTCVIKMPSIIGDKYVV